MITKIATILCTLLIYIVCINSFDSPYNFNMIWVILTLFYRQEYDMENLLSKDYLAWHAKKKKGVQI